MTHRQVRDVLTTDVRTVYAGSPAKVVAEQLDVGHVSALPVVDDDFHVIGVVSEADLLAAELRPRQPTTTSSLKADASRRARNGRFLADAAGGRQTGQVRVNALHGPVEGPLPVDPRGVPQFGDAVAAVGLVLTWPACGGENLEGNVAGDHIACCPIRLPSPFLRVLWVVLPRQRRRS